MRYPDPCPRCYGRAWLEVENDPVAGKEVVKKCMCGYRASIYNEKLGYLRIPKGVVQLQVPPRDSQLYRCLVVVYSVHPDEVSTTTVADTMSVSKMRASSYLSVLRIKGFIDCTDSRKGQRGGSLWRLSRQGVKTLQL